MKRRTVLSMEQALSLPYATLRFAQLGWRVIRIEATGGEGLRVRLPGGELAIVVEPVTGNGMESVLRKALRVHEAWVNRVHVDPPRSQLPGDRPREAELGSGWALTPPPSLP